MVINFRMTCYGSIIGYTGDYEIKAINISEEAKKESREIINDLIIAAYNNAKENLKKKSSEELSKATGGMNLPFDLKFPL